MFCRDFDVVKARESVEAYNPRGVHGYDYEHLLMRAIFIAKGPAFSHKANSRLGVFRGSTVIRTCDARRLICS